MAIGPDALAVGLGKRQIAGAGTGCNDDMFRGEGFSPLLALHFKLAGGQQFALAHMHGDLVLFHQVGDPLIKLLGHTPAARNHRAQIGADLLRRQTVVLGVLHKVENLGRTQQRLGGDTAPVEADPAEQFALDNRDFEAQLRRPDRRNIAAGAGTEDDEVVLVRHKFLANDTRRQSPSCAEDSRNGHNRLQYDIPTHLLSIEHCANCWYGYRNQNT